MMVLGIVELGNGNLGITMEQVGVVKVDGLVVVGLLTKLIHFIFMPMLIVVMLILIL